MAQTTNKVVFDRGDRFADNFFDRSDRLIDGTVTERSALRIVAAVFAGIVVVLFGTNFFFGVSVLAGGRGGGVDWWVVTLLEATTAWY